MSAYLYPLVFLPVIIDEVGEYLTRSGEVVSIEQVSDRHDFGCKGRYDQCGTPESWHKSGRLMANLECENDVLKRI